MAQKRLLFGIYSSTVALASYPIFDQTARLTCSDVPLEMLCPLEGAPAMWTHA